jgi:hypothetical protein
MGITPLLVVVRNTVVGVVGLKMVQHQHLTVVVLCMVREEEVLVELTELQETPGHPLVVLRVHTPRAEVEMQVQMGTHQRLVVLVQQEVQVQDVAMEEEVEAHLHIT